MAAKKKNANGVKAYLRKIGKKGGKSTMAGRSAEDRKALAKKAIEARWKKWREEHPDKKK